MDDACPHRRSSANAASLPLLFARYADNGDHASLAQLFTEDCEFARPFQPDHPFYGRDRVQAIFRDRPPILVRHIVTNVLVEAMSETEARGTNYLTMLSSHASTEPPQEAGGDLRRRVRRSLRAARPAAGASRAATAAWCCTRAGRCRTFPPPSDEARGLK